METGELIAGRYRLIRQLGAGGMGEVWQARNELTNRDFAIKFLLPEFANHREAFDRFVQEAETTGKLQHPSIIDVYDVAQSKDGRPFIVMELLRGEELEHKLTREGTLSPFRTAVIFAQIAAGLQMAHQAGVVHRDLSSANIFLAKDLGRDAVMPKILDFGVSKNVGPEWNGGVTTSNGAVLGNPMYMSPEQACGAETVDFRTDIWTLGVVMYQCLTGRLPFRENNYNALMVSIMTVEHRPLLELVPTIDPELAKIIEHCLQKDRENRLSTALELGSRLSAVALRLANDPAEIGRTPMRRSTDRLPSAASLRAEADLLQAQVSASKPWASRALIAFDGQLVKSRFSMVAGLLMAGLLMGFATGRISAPKEKLPEWVFELQAQQYEQKQLAQRASEAAPTERQGCVEKAASKEVASEESSLTKAVALGTAKRR